MSADLILRVGRGSRAAALVDDRWDALALAQARPQAAAGREWVGAAVERAGAGALVVLAERAGRPAAAIALDVRPLTPRAGPRIGRPLGAPRPLIGADLLVAPGDPAAGRELVRSLRAHVAGVEATVPVSGPLATALAAVAPWRRAAAEPVMGWRLELPGQRLARRRERVAYHLRRAERLGARVEREVHAEPAAIGAALERLLDLHGERWRGRADAVPFSRHASDRDWHRRAVAAAARAGRARIAEVREDGRSVAAILLLLAGRGATLYAGAISEGGRLKGPGHVAILTAIEAAMAAGAQAVDLGRGEEEYKMRFAPAPDPSIRVIAASRAAWQAPLMAALAAQRRAVRARRRLRRRPAIL